MLEDQQRIKGYEKNNTYSVGVMLLDAIQLLVLHNYTKEQVLKLVETRYDLVKAYYERKNG